MHSYFLRAGSADTPVVYMVTRLRDGRSFATRSVTATQDGEPIFFCVCSFQFHEVSEYRHQMPMPMAPDPEEVPDSPTRWKKLLDDVPDMPPRQREYVEQQVQRATPIDIRVCDDGIIASWMDREPQTTAWIRAHGRVGDDDPNLHRCIVAYASDFQLLGTALKPHGYAPDRVRMMASLDHSMWFHGPAFRADEWLLYEIQSPASGDNRGFSLGRLYRQDGTLVVSVAQEGVIRLAPSAAPAASPAASLVTAAPPSDAAAEGDEGSSGGAGGDGAAGSAGVSGDGAAVGASAPLAAAAAEGAPAPIVRSRL